MPLSLGTRIGSYEVLGPLGVGGMGEVYRARDTKLKREIALKVLPEPFANDPERMARFQREAEVLAALNHPNIAQIYGVEERALVMELVEGETLKGPLPLETALNYARQIAAALEAAHAKGIVHRDLKPANVKVTPDGIVKVLDFGLAQLSPDRERAESDPSNSPTFTMSPTRAGMILGTAAYMSPEQARGKPVDKRADIWAFGVVLYEMLTGKQAFKGETITDVLAAVVKEEPDLTRVPANVRRLLESCLQKDPAQRLQSIGDFRWLLEETTPQTAAQATGLPWKILATGFAIVALVLGAAYFRRPTEQPRVVKLSLLPPENTIFGGDLPAISPDGRRLAFVVTTGQERKLWIRDLDSVAARPLAGTERASYPFWSPDSRFIGFFTLGKLKSIDVTSGAVLTLCDAGNARGASWNQNGVILFTPDTRGVLLRVPATGGAVTPATTLDQALGEVSHRFPWFLPDGRHFLYTATSANLEKATIYLANLDSKERRPVLEAASNVVYTPPGYLLFVRDRTLMAQPFDPGQGKTTGDSVAVAEQIGYTPVQIQGQFTASQNGVLVYASDVGGQQNGQLTWFDRSGNSVGRIGGPGLLSRPAISPDGNIVAVDRPDQQTLLADIWLYDVRRDTATRFTFNSRFNDRPVWSPDGSHIAFRSTLGVGANLYQKATSGMATEEALDKAKGSKFPYDWSQDGRYLIEGVTDPKTKLDIWVLPLFGDRKPFPYLQTEFNEAYARLSPNGKWLAYTSDETKRAEIYVQSFPTPGGKWQISTNGGLYPVWSRDGKELFYIGPDQKLTAVEVMGGDKFAAGTPRPLFTMHRAIVGGGRGGWFDVSKDGRFLMPIPVENAAPVPMTVVVNWTAGLKR
jgi:Tol biopolymer transport system component/predicted Ser/Thr protein kinase